MSIEMLNWAFTLKMASAADKAVLVALANHADPTGKCWPSVARLCLYTALAERTVRAVLGRLEDAGLINRTEVSGKTTRYHLNAGVQGQQGCTSRTPPLQQMQPTPAPAAPEPSTTLTQPTPTPPRAKTKRHIEPGWQPTPELKAWASAAYPLVEIEHETDRFIDYWLGRGEAKADWAATWRNWIRRAATYKPARVIPLHGARGAQRTEGNRERLRQALDAAAASDNVLGSCRQSYLRPVD